MTQVTIDVTLFGDVEGGVDNETGFYTELAKAIDAVAKQFGLESYVDEVSE